MASHQSIIDELLDHLTNAGNVSARKMFGEYCVYLNDKPVALVCDDILYVKPTEGGRKLMLDATEEPPYPGAKPYLVVPVDQWGDAESLCHLMRTTFKELPKAKPKLKARKRRA